MPEGMFNPSAKIVILSNRPCCQSSESPKLSFSAPGSQIVTVTELGRPGVRGDSGDIQVYASVVTHLQVDASGGNNTAGQPIGIRVRARSDRGDVVPGYRGTIRFTSTDTGGLDEPASPIMDERLLRFAAQYARVRLDVATSPRLNTTLFAQWDNESERVALNARGFALLDCRRRFCAFVLSDCRRTRLDDARRSR